MTLDNMTGITEGSYTGFCKSQLITCNRVKECNGVCPFEDALKHADKTKTINEQHTVNHDRDWIIGCIEHDGFIHTHRFDKANQIILDALSAETLQGWIPCSERLPDIKEHHVSDPCLVYCENGAYGFAELEENIFGQVGWNCEREDEYHEPIGEVLAWMPLPKPYKGGEDE